MENTLIYFNAIRVTRNFATSVTIGEIYYYWYEKDIVHKLIEFGKGGGVFNIETSNEVIVNNAILSMSKSTFGAVLNLIKFN